MAVKKIAVVGAGVAGARVAELLGRNDFSVRLFDFRAPWEKPCGGGLTHKVLIDFPDLRPLADQGREHKRVHILFPSGRRDRLSLIEPIVTVSRKQLGTYLLDGARAAGVEFKQERVKDLARRESTWLVRTDQGEYESDFVVGAEGVNGVVRQSVASPLPREDLCLTFGAILPKKVDLPIVIKFFRDHLGYAFIFPRGEDTSVGIALEGGEADRDGQVALLQAFVTEEWTRKNMDPPELEKPRACLLPTLRLDSFTDPVLAGEGWALIGDASGSADPLTGEGIYYALKTAQLLATALKSGDISNYPASWQAMARTSIGKVAKVNRLFYDPLLLRLLGIFLDYSPAVRMLTRDLISGIQGYDTLKPRVKKDWPIYLREALLNLAAFNPGERKKKRRRSGTRSPSRRRSRESD